jgi:hypothetical protein
MCKSIWAFLHEEQSMELTQDEIYEILKIPYAERGRVKDKKSTQLRKAFGLATQWLGGVCTCIKLERSR